MEPSLPPLALLPSSPMPHSQHITQSGSTPCGICTNPVDEPLKVNDSLTGPSLPHSDPSPTSLELTTELSTPAPVATALMASHPMITRAKAGIFKNRHMFAAMDEEVQALQTNRTWILVSCPTNTNIVGSKWVFRTKYLPDGSIERLKARLVAKGYTQPPRYIDPRFPNHVCQLKKTLYGLKQAPRAWQSDIIYLLLYVDDIIIIGNNSSFLDSFSRKLNTKFTTKDLGSLSYFLGLEATSTTDGLFLSQLKYARDILTRAQLLDNKPVHTPMVVSQHLSSDGPLFSDPTLYRSLVGALQYLTITRPDIAHVVNSISQFLHSLTEDHFLVVKRILRYVKGTLHFGLTFHPSTVPGVLVAYSYAN
ncbi:Retrovirus-related Pol polyprotein from transposon RE1 [Vitis vinifera]|uniref:Retrovirus-related Pol polyprotein from transposon RE1 n=1 Tax=Vitis vinifera TaxID=29760 RepID=A0A438FR08_VITVI|nr:Retrovirus-related Pol polyprotein from transposon RE1 [Vitis vinifera]